MNGKFSNSPPVKEGDEVDVTIDQVGAKGDGIARVKGFVVFVPEVSEGDRKRIQITKVLEKVGFGKVIGDAQSTPPTRERKPQKSREELFESNEHLDSEDF
jgi:predicted RNA-binding protein with TRAM domain